MQLTDFTFEVPDHLIAQHPPPTRSASRLMVLDGSTGSIDHKQFTELPSLLEPGDLLVLNDTRVIPARLYGRKETGGKLEILFERVLENNQVLARIRASKSPQPGTGIILASDTRANYAPAKDTPASNRQAAQVTATVLRRQGEFFVLGFGEGLDPLELLHRQGSVPLPPYITRDAEPSDIRRYQTVYSKIPGAVAAPTAGLHFDDSMLTAVRERGIDITTITLHVGAGTFQPIRVSNIDNHVMHAEHIDVSADTIDRINETRSRGGRVIAVGTTTVRSLESAAQNGTLQPYTGDTRIFLKPGARFNVIDAMVTNFHLPESTLMLLVAAFCGKEQILRAYQEAIRQEYRFYSYGDAMLLWPDKGVRIG